MKSIAATRGMPQALVERLYQAEVKATLDFSTSSSTVFIVSTSDDAIQDIVGEIVLPEEAILIHTSGSQPLNILSDAATADLGVFYPLQTFSKNSKVDFSTVPVFCGKRQYKYGENTDGDGQGRFQQCCQNHFVRTTGPSCCRGFCCELYQSHVAAGAGNHEGEQLEF